MKQFLLLILIMNIISLSVYASTPKTHIYYEKEYQNAWCRANGGITEVILPDKARVDCVTKTHAIEFDFTKKWAESIGQSLYYGQQLHKKAGIVLISENDQSDEKYIKRVKSVANCHNIDLWIMTPEQMK